MGNAGSSFFGKGNANYNSVRQNDNDSLILSMIQENLDHNYDTYTIPEENPKLNSISGRGDKCTICKEYMAVHVIKPCGHRCLCNTCAVNLPKRGISTCPVVKCGEKINEIV